MPPPGAGNDVRQAVADLGTIASTAPWFLIVARADYDGDGIPCTVVGMSHLNSVIVESSGE